MTRSARHSVIRLGMAAAMVAALISCGGGETDSSNRNRNAALEECLPGDPPESTTTIENDPCSSTTTTAYDEASQAVTCDVLWDAESKTLTSCGDSYGMNVEVLDADGNGQGNARYDGATAKVVTFDGSATVRAVVFMSAAAYASGESTNTIDFDVAVSTSKSFTYTPAPVDPLKDETDLLRFSTIIDNASPWVSQTIKLDAPLVSADEVTATVSARLNGQDTTAGELTVSMVLSRGPENVLQKDASMSDTTTFETLTISLKNEEIDITGVDTITLNINGHSGKQWSGNYGPDVTFAGVTVNGAQKLANTGFSDGTTAWTSTSGFQQCSGDTGEKPCVTSAVVTDTPETTTTVEETPITVEETPITVEETTTSVEETPSNGEETQTTSERLAATISVQEVPCAANFVAGTRTVTLCESFDRIVGATFDGDGKFVESIAASGSSFEIPQAVLDNGGARFVRIAVGQKMNGLDVATFRGEGLLDLADGTADVSATVYASPAGQEAINSAGTPDYMEVALRDDGKFDIYEIDDNELAFVTLNGEVFAEYDRVTPPSSWDEGKPLAWRAYQTDGFGLPRLVASGSIALGARSDVDYANPAFELNSQRIELLTGEAAGQGPDETENTCGADRPYMITTPITPSNSNLVTITVATDCKSTDSLLGLVVYDYDNNDVPVFSQFKSTRYSSRMVATTFLADGEYDVLWGDTELVGTHEYVVNGGGSGAECHHPQLDIDGASKKATLRNCDPGAHRMRVYAEPLFWGPEDDDIRLPFKDNVIDLSMVTWEGFFELNMKIDDALEPDFILCVNNCGSAYRADEGVSATVDTSAFAGSGRVSVTGTCTKPTLPEGFSEVWSDGEVDVYRPAGNGAFIWETWLPINLEESPYKGDRSFHLPSNGQYVTLTSCEAEGYNEQGEWGVETASAIQTFEITDSMPNRPSNDQFADAPAIGPNVGAVEFTNVSATNEQGEMGIEFSNSRDAGQFHSVWFTYTPEESRDASFRLTEYDFAAMMRVTTRNEDGSTTLLDEAEMWWEDRYYCGCDTTEWESVSFSAKAGTTYYIQITNEDYDSSVGSAILLVNGGEGDLVKVQAGDQPFLGADQLKKPFPTTTTTTVVAPTTSVVATTGTDGGAPSTTTPVSSANQSYRNAIEQGSSNDLVTVLAPVKDAPATIETRQDARTVQIPVADLYGTVSAASANVNTARSLTLRQNGRRPIRVRPTDEFVTVPVGTSTEELTVVATDSAGKTIAAPITIKKTVAPLVKVSGSSPDGGSSVTLYAGIGALVLVLLGAGYVVLSRRKEDETGA